MKKLKSTLENYAFILPALLIFFIFYVIPFIWVFQFSLTNWDGIQPIKKFIGLDNFKEILFTDKSWWRAFLNAGYICLIALIFQNTLAFLLALACSRKIRFRNFYQTVFFIPPILSEIVVGMVWRFILNDIDGANILNRLLNFIGLSQFVNKWLANPNIVLTTIAFVHSWKGFGWGFLIFLAGLVAIPTELYEAAILDGASSLKCFRKITLPLMLPVIALVSILTILGTMQGFVLILGLVGGEFAGYASVPVLRILAAMRDYLRFGYACAQGVSLGLILVIVSFIQYKLLKKFRKIIA
ncbi:MAG: sugar ABC transporter permease [Candidatus Omnitrophica bacterium]|nr:sugar ABC transporter permease [Candidatus Omnitrophota bacterium]